MMDLVGKLIGFSGLWPWAEILLSLTIFVFLSAPQASRTHGIEWKKKRNDRVGCFLLRPAHAASNANPNECESCGFVGQPEVSLKVRSRACCQAKVRFYL